MLPRPHELALYDAIRLVRPLHRHVYKSVELGLASEGITVAMRALLERLGESGPQTVPQAARALGFRRQFIQRLADDLLARGLVVYAANPAHRRSRLVALSAAGDALMRRVREREAVQLRELAAPLSAGDIAVFHRVMTYLTDTFARQAPIDPEIDPQLVPAVRRV
jgi:DNA-binding MarR family transcriptional regulator